MTLSILAVLFLLMLIAVIFYGYGFVMKQTKSSSPQNIEQCIICKKEFRREQLVEREIRDSKLIYFCRACVIRLYDDASKI
jgi:hypothetical protein